MEKARVVESRICKGNGGFGLGDEGFVRFGWWVVTVLAVTAASFTTPKRCVHLLAMARNGRRDIFGSKKIPVYNHE